MDWNPRRKSIAFSASLGLLSTAFLAGGIYTTDAMLGPLQEGFDWATERSLSRSTQSLTVLVSRYDAGEVERIPGAKVTIERLGRGDTESVEVASSLTGADGRARFELAPGSRFGGGYFVKVEHEAVSTSWGTQLDEDVRLGVYIKPDGSVGWRSISHADLEERGGDVAVLGVRMMDKPSCELDAQGRPGYCPGVAEGSIHVRIYSIKDGSRGALVSDARHPEDAANGGRDARLAPGLYDVQTTYKGVSRTDRVELLCDLTVFAVYDGSTLTLEHPIRCASGGVVGVEG